MSATLPERDLAGLFASYGGETSLDVFMKKALDGCVDWFDAARVSLFLKNDFTGDYWLSGQAGPDSTIPVDTILRSGEGLAGKAIHSGKPKLLTDSEGSHRRKRDRGSAVIIPLIAPEAGCLGVLNVARREGDEPFTTSDLGTIESIARYVALAINNARLLSRMNQAMGQAKAMHEKLDAVISCLGVGVLVVTEFEEVTGWNPEATAIFGSSLEAGVLLRHVLAHAPIVLRVAVEQAFLLGASGERVTRRAFDSSTDQGWSVIASPLPAGGATLAIQDITDHERATRELSRVRRLAEIGQMTAAVAHEIRNPLTGIRSAAQMVQGVSEEACEYGKIIEEEALKLNGLCDQFLEFARPLALNIREFDPSEVVRYITEQHRQDFDRAGVRLDFRRTAPSPTIKGDPLRLEQVVRNLVLNALQASNAGGHVSVEVDGPRIQIRDSGSGIEPHMMDKLFTPFFTTKPNGTGLGLSTVRKIVDAHGWEVKVHSAPGTGTTFELDFGLEEAA
jgi:signal transduction histidine kinase